MTGLLYSPEPGTGSGVVSSFEVVAVVVLVAVGVALPTAEITVQANQSSMTTSGSRQQLH